MKKILSLCALALSVYATNANAQSWDMKKPLKLTAYSRNAMAITGDVQVSKSALTAGSGKKIAWTFVGQEGDHFLFRVNSKDNPKLLYGNQICGDGGIKYMVVVQNVTEKIISIQAYEDSKIAKEGEVPDPNESCAIYNYIRR